jgi:hypothetical protein
LKEKKMQDKKTKQQAALSRLNMTLASYRNGEWEPSQKDEMRGTTLEEKIKRCERDIAHLTKIIDNS